MIQLEAKHFIAKGTNRACYSHPNDASKCIKVTISNDYSESKKEIRYYNYLTKKMVSWKFIAKYYARVKTNLGDGDVFDLVRDEDGSISKTLSYYLQSEERTKSIVNPVILLKELKKYTLEENIVVKDLNTKNMLYQATRGDVKLVLIDGVQNNNFLYYSNRIDYLAKKKINKLWKVFEFSLRNKYDFNTYFFTLLLAENSS